MTDKATERAIEAMSKEHDLYYEGVCESPNSLLDMVDVTLKETILTALRALQPGKLDENIHDRLSGIQERLVVAGYVDCKLMIPPPGSDIDQALSETVDILEAILDGKHSPMKPFGDSQRLDENGLLPCPFCGDPVKLEQTIDGSKFWGIVCRSTKGLGGTCAIQIRPSRTKEAAISRWNTRNGVTIKADKEGEV